MPDSLFNQQYYEKIWPEFGVHRHDYCEGMAEFLISKYGKVRFLDIGTGCGYLVKTLREKGALAWGLEISKYAVENSCAKSFMRQGDVLNIPYAPNSFDVVFSSGLWCHVAEKDIDKAWNECQRVGTLQEHNIDYEEAPEDIPYFITRHSQEWWLNKFYPKILLAMPTHELKEYCFQEWIDCVKAIDYPNLEIFVVDNSPNTDFLNRWIDQVPSMIHINSIQGTDSTFVNIRTNMSMAIIAKKYLEGDYAWWFDLEADVIIPPQGLKLLLKYPSDWTSHDYPVRGGGGRMSGVGCSLLSKDIIKAYDFSNAPAHQGPDNYLWNKAMSTHTSITLTNILDVKHLGGSDGYGA